MEDDLKISKVEYLINYWSDRPQILNLHLGDQTENFLDEEDLQLRTTLEYY